MYRWTQHQQQHQHPVAHGALTLHSSYYSIWNRKICNKSVIPSFGQSNM